MASEPGPRQTDWLLKKQPVVPCSENDNDISEQPQDLYQQIYHLKDLRELKAGLVWAVILWICLVKEASVMNKIIFHDHHFIIQFMIWLFICIVLVPIHTICCTDVVFWRIKKQKHNNLPVSPSLSTCRKLWLVRAASCCCDSWWGPECCSSPTGWAPTGGRY